MRTTIGSSNSQAARTFNVKSKLPEIYNELTSTNFGLQAQQSYVFGSTSLADRSNNILGPYNASTGVLSCNVASCRKGEVLSAWITYTVYCWYIK